jgi:hypothetical protein
MRKTLLNALLCGTVLPLGAQYSVGFETTPLSTTETYWNGSDGSSNGINEANCFFPTVWNNSFGGYWQTGFALSNMTDSVTSGFQNMYAAKAGSGYESAQYAVAYGNYNFTLQSGTIQSLYITNNTYAYNSMRDGDDFAKKFGGLTGNDPDFFSITFKGYNGGIEKPDSLTFYLADFRFDDNVQDYIVRDWTPFSLAALGIVDSVTYRFESSDVGSFGYNTPTYFCLDNLTILPALVGTENPVSIKENRLFPNPSNESFSFIEQVETYSVFNSAGQTMEQCSNPTNRVDCSQWSAGTYIVVSKDKHGVYTKTFISVSH